jgi:uncharacterized protein
MTKKPGVVKKRKVLLHVNEMSRWPVALKNIQNLFKNVGGSKFTETRILANGEAAKGCSLDTNWGIATEIKKLSDQGAKFYVCRNALNMAEIDESRVLEFIEIVPAGITFIIDSQNDEGFAYIKP